MAILNAVILADQITNFNKNKFMREIAGSMVEFVKKNQGKWDHDAWVTFLKGLQDKEISFLTKRTTDYIVSILEAAKELYRVPEIAKETAQSRQKNR